MCSDPHLAQDAAQTAFLRGWQLLRAEWKDVGLMWLILVGVNLVYGLGSVLVGLFLVAGALVLGSVFGLLVNAVSGGSLAASAIVGGIIFLLVLGLPLVFAKGLLETYISSAWTLAYRELTLAALPETDDAPELPDRQTVS